MVVASSAGAVAPCSSSLRMRAQTVTDAIPRDTKRKHCFAISIVKGCTSGFQPPLTIFAFCVLFEGWAKSKILPLFPRPLIPLIKVTITRARFPWLTSSLVLAVYTPLLCRREPPQFNGGFKQQEWLSPRKTLRVFFLFALRASARLLLASRALLTN